MHDLCALSAPCTCACTLRVREFFIFAPHSPLRSAAREHHPSGGVHPTGARPHTCGVLPPPSVGPLRSQKSFLFNRRLKPSVLGFASRARARSRSENHVHAIKFSRQMACISNLNVVRGALWPTSCVQNEAKIRKMRPNF